MANQDSIAAIITRLAALERNLGAHEESTQQNLKTFFDTIVARDENMQKIMDQYQNVMMLIPESQERITNKLMDQVEKSGETMEKMADRAEKWQDKYLQLEEEHEEQMAKQRKKFERVIAVLLRKNARLQGRDELGSHLMKMVSERQEELAQKYSSLTQSESGTMFNAGDRVHLINDSIPRLN